MAFSNKGRQQDYRLHPPTHPPINHEQVKMYEKMPGEDFGPMAGEGCLALPCLLYVSKVEPGMVGQGRELAERATLLIPCPVTTHWLSLRLLQTKYKHVPDQGMLHG